MLEKHVKPSTQLVLLLTPHKEIAGSLGFPDGSEGEVGQVRVVGAIGIKEESRSRSGAFRGVRVFNSQSIGAPSADKCKDADPKSAGGTNAESPDEVSRQISRVGSRAVPLRPADRPLGSERPEMARQRL